MSPTPICLFVNCLDVTVSSSEVNARAHPLTLLKDIPDLTETPDTAPRWDNSVTRQWAIKNKYYDARVEVVAIPSPLLPGVHNPALGCEGLSDRVEALVLCFGGGEQTSSASSSPVGKGCSTASFNLIKHWKPFVDSFAPPIRLLICEGFSDDESQENENSIRQSEVIGWCIDNQFELVQLDEDDEEEEEEEENDGNSLGRPFASGEYGLPRVLAALHAHTWSNLKLKSSRTQASGGVDEDEEEEKEKTDEEGGEKKQRKEAEAEKEATVKEKKKPTREEERLNEIFGNIDLTGIGDDDDDEESFQQLFNKMAQLKSQSQNMAFEDRKVFAEQVTMAFWRAVGGDEDELDGLDDDDDQL